VYLVNSDILVRPKPPLRLHEPDDFGDFEPAKEVNKWVGQTFLDERSALFDEEHSHLLQANVGYLWTNAYNETKQVQVIGQASLAKPHPALGKWQKKELEWLYRKWFEDPKAEEGFELDFIIRIYAPDAATANDMEFCSLIKHELSHCAQGLDEYKNPAWYKSGPKKGRPKLVLKDHDFAGFHSNVRDFGPGAERGVPELLEIVKQPPRVAWVDVSRMCGNCLQLNA